MKTFIVYSLDTELPIAVGEAIRAEWARVEAADKAKVRAENLIAEEIAIQVPELQHPDVYSLKRFWNKSRGK